MASGKWLSPALNPELLRAYLAAVLGQPVMILQIGPLGEPTQPGVVELKEYGYGRALLIDCEVGGVRRRVVLRTVKPGAFGHEHMADRAAELLWSHHAFNTLPRHVRSIDVGGFDASVSPRSVGGISEFFLLTEFVPGREYALDLTRIRQSDTLETTDVQRADALCDYLIDIHGTRGGEPGLYVRRIRELIGHGECIMGLTDSYPVDHPIFSPAVLEAIETAAVRWRWRLRSRTHRLRQVHGDFHPWNILFNEGASFHVLDRSRGEWGDPADDVTSLTTNYLFLALQSHGTVRGPFAELYGRFWDRYLAAGDVEMRQVAAPFIAFRALVMASPVWYPHLTDDIRRAMLRLIQSVLTCDAFDPERINDYLAG